jgi:presenilin-like A22 family membrane protease
MLAEKTEKPKFKVELIYLAPILISLLFGLGCAYLLAPVETGGTITPAPEETPGAPFINATYFVVLLAISATIFYILLKRRSERIIRALIVIALTTASLLLSLIYLDALFAYMPSLRMLVIPLSIVITIIFNLAIFRLGSLARNTAVILMGGALGIFFSKFIPLPSAILILIFLAIYDVIAVYRGPVGKIAESSGLDQLHGLSYSFKEIQMGLGDLVFYSMLSGSILFSFGIIPCVIAIVGILTGSIITFFMLDKKGIFPGLPFPIMLGLAGGLITGFLI